MKHLTFYASICLLLLASSCVKDHCRKVITYTKYNPVYKSLDEIRIDPVMQAPRAMNNPGKIYLYGTMLLINERNEGIHFYDNADPSNPQPLAFLPIPGNLDMAVNANMLYADNYTDVVVIDINDWQNIRFRKRLEDVYTSFETDPEKGLLVQYEAEEVTEEVDCNFMPPIQDPTIMNGNFAVQPAIMSSTGSSGSGREAVGIGGSMARFTINAGHLYIVDRTSLMVFDVAVADNPVAISQAFIGVNIETIFPHGPNLFIGSSLGMYIYDVSNPQQPTFLSVFQHADVCDPVFVDDQFAYVTLRTGTECNGFINQLDVLDVSDLTDPEHISSTPMVNPHGLSVKDDHLYLCEGASGVKVFDVTNKLNIGQQQLFNDDSRFAFDVIAIPNRDVIIVVGEDGFYQYDTQNPSSLNLLSHIAIQP